MGVPEWCDGTTNTTLKSLNPLRYRGYVYDQETGLYYLQSRYYNPEWGRFINADGTTSTGQGMLGNNMYAYCNNNPIMLADPSGRVSMYNLMASDSGLNIQYHTYLELQKLKEYDPSYKYFLEPGANLDAEFENGNIVVEGYAALATGTLNLNDSFSIVTSALGVSCEICTGKDGMTVEIGAHIMEISAVWEIAPNLQAEASVSLGVKFGIGLSSKGLSIDFLFFGFSLSWG